MILEDDIRLTQIGHLVLGCRSIVVLETKTYAGVITGEPDDAEWTQHLRGGEQRYEFLNPLRQNQRHCRAVEAQLAPDPPNIEGRVVSAGSAVFSDAIALEIVPIAKLADIFGGTVSDERPDERLLGGWRRLQSAASRGESLRERHATMRATSRGRTT